MFRSLRLGPTARAEGRRIFADAGVASRMDGRSPWRDEAGGEDICLSLDLLFLLLLLVLLLLSSLLLLKLRVRAPRGRSAIGGVCVHLDTQLPAPPAAAMR